MKETQSNCRSRVLIVWAALLLLAAPNEAAIAQSCCSAKAEGEASTSAASCAAHGELGLPDSPTARMVHAFVDLTYTSGEDALQAFLEQNLSPSSRERKGDESLLQALRMMRV